MRCCITGAHEDEQMHDHARRSLTIVLKGELIEKHLGVRSALRAGSIVFGRPNTFTAFASSRSIARKTWTLFVVGRRIGVQNTYSVERRFEAPIRRGAK
jgi:hypothetical protein